MRADRRKPALRLALPATILFCLLAGRPAVAEVLVGFPQPGRYTDASLNGDVRTGAVNPALPALRDALQQLGGRYLPPNATLRIEVEDIDLAGRYEPWRVAGRDTRILRDVDPPRFRLRYTLERPGQPAVTAEETVTDLLYLSRPEARFRDGDRLALEKAVLADWFRKRFAPG